MLFMQQAGVEHAWEHDDLRELGQRDRSAAAADVLPRSRAGSPICVCAWPICSASWCPVANSCAACKQGKGLLRPGDAPWASHCHGMCCLQTICLGHSG